MPVSSGSSTHAGTSRVEARSILERNLPFATLAKFGAALHHKAMKLDIDAARFSEPAFMEEQARLGRVWTYLGLQQDIPNRDDWFTARLGGREIVVQRFESGLSAFENKCAHRGFPLRTGPKGNGALVCGFHHWKYNAEGLALGIPHCLEMFGKTPREMNARLNRVELAQCGNAIFGRFADTAFSGEAGNGSQEASALNAGLSLESWLGPAFPILKHFTTVSPKDAGRHECVIPANWRYLMDISLDDYHIVAVHPSTFGKNGYLSADRTFYTRFGAHSSYILNGNETSLDEWAAACEAGDFYVPRYRILQLAPFLIVTFVHAFDYLGGKYWYMLMMQLVPEAHDRTRTIARYFPLPLPKNCGPAKQFFRDIAWPSIHPGFKFYARRVQKEDNDACALLQQAARPDDPASRLARQETRVRWFNESYAAMLNGDVPEAGVYTRPPG